MQMWETGSKEFTRVRGVGMGQSAAGVPGRAPGRSRGFTILELMAAMTIAGLVLAVTVPASARLYQSMQYRAAVKDVVTVLSAARYQAVNDGRAQDVTIDTQTNVLRLNDVVQRLPSELRVGVLSAGELNSDGLAVIRYYPEGGSSGGEVSVEIPQRYGVRVIVDWLVGGISQEKYALN